MVRSSSVSNSCTGNAMQVVFALQPTPIGTDLLTIYPMGLALADAVLNRSGDEDMRVEVLQAVLIIGITVMENIGKFRSIQSPAPRARYQSFVPSLRVPVHDAMLPAQVPSGQAQVR